MGEKFVRWDPENLVDQVRSVCEVQPNGCWVWRYLGYTGSNYPQVMVKRQRKTISRWLLEVTTGEIGEVARHRCDNPPCCNPEHLVWGTQAENMQDALARGRRPRKQSRSRASLRAAESYARGSHHGRARFTEDEVRGIRAKYAAGASIYRLAKDAGVSKCAIKLIVERVTWTHI